MLLVTYNAGVSKNVKHQLGNGAGGNQLIKKPGSARRLCRTQTNPINCNVQNNVNRHSVPT